LEAIAEASELFYEHGVHTVGTDKIIERAVLPRPVSTAPSGARTNSSAPISRPATTHAATHGERA
jgi:hypothetical protein